jgi:FlaA1/EpsC-like NDP-sugar epimerase
MPLRNRHLFLGDVVTLPLALWLAFVTRFEGMPWPAGMWTVFGVVLVLGVPAKLAAMWRVGLYGRLWSYASVRDVTVLAGAVVAAMIVTALIGLIVVPAWTEAPGGFRCRCSLSTRC